MKWSLGYDIHLHIIWEILVVSTLIASTQISLMGEKNVILEHVVYKDGISRNERKVKLIL